MSMSIILSELKTVNDRISAEYKEISKGIIVTDFIDNYLSNFTSDLKAYEDDDEIIYKEIKEKDIDNLSEKITNQLLTTLKKINNKENNDEKLNDLYDLTELINIFMIYYKVTCKTEKNIKIIIV